MDTHSIASTSTKSAQPRLWEVDTVRGVAVVLMIIYHFVYDLAFFRVYAGNMMSDPWQFIARSIGTTFIVLMGVSLTLRYHRLAAGLDRRQLFARVARRGVGLFAWGMVITLVTYLSLGNRYVVFGILHLLGLAGILAFPFLRARWASLVTSLLTFGLAAYLEAMMAAHPWLLWLGVRQIGRHMVDYYPIIPWFGFALLGVFLGLTLYPNGARQFHLPDLSHARPVRALIYLGQHSLVIYLRHQPVLIGLLFVLGIASL